MSSSRSKSAVKSEKLPRTATMPPRKPPLEFYKDADFERVVDTRALPTGYEEPYRTPFRRDYARIIHAPAFRRLQRKTQLFPGDESDFFRNRLTHSLEVAQIAKSIALRLNWILQKKYDTDGIDTDLIELAGLAHDIGHPPFGHTGEHALHELMFASGGFEGNAQTLRILSRLEKRQTRGEDGIEFHAGADLRLGLNLSYRSLASILKYDARIPSALDNKKLVKGYYASEADLVSEIKRKVAPGFEGDRFATIEMQIMDLADDIAYSTYDLEDALKAGFATPLDLLQQANDNEDLKQAVAQKLFRNSHGRDFPVKDASEDDLEALESIKDRMVNTVIELISNYLIEVDCFMQNEERSWFTSEAVEQRALDIAAIAVMMQDMSGQVATNGYVRAQFTSDIIGQRIRSIDIVVNEDFPCLSAVHIPSDVRFQIDVLKHMTFELHIKSPRLKLIEFRGKQIVSELFDCFEKDIDGELLPGDWRDRLRSFNGFPEKAVMRKRLICDYIAGMTDAYALDLYARLKSTNPAALFRPF